MRKHLARQGPAMVIAVIALFAALGGTSYAKKKLGLGALTPVAKINTVGVGPLTYATSTLSVAPTGSGGLTVSAVCPTGTYPVGGGIRVFNDATMLVNDSHPIAGGWAGTVFNSGTVAANASVTVACASSLRPTTPPSTTS